MMTRLQLDAMMCDGCGEDADALVLAQELARPPHSIAAIWARALR